MKKNLFKEKYVRKYPFKFSAIRKFFGNDFFNLPLISANEAFEDYIVLNCTQSGFVERDYCMRGCFALLN